MKLSLLLCPLVFIALSFGALVHGQDARTALVIGCDYKGTGFQLPSPVRDVDALAAKLKEVGFAAKDITVLKNPSRKQMLEAIDVFGATVKNRGGAGFFYFSGHGAQLEGDNFLIPAGATLGYREDLPTEAVAASRIVTRMEAAGNPVNMLFLDACRTNELPSGKQKSALSKGLTSMGGSGLLIGFAAAANRPSLDSGEGSFYTNALLRHMTTPGLSVLQMLTRVRQDVKKATENIQEPFLYAGLDNDFFFVGESKLASLPPAPLATPKPTAGAPAATPKPRSTAVATPNPPGNPASGTKFSGIEPGIATVDMKSIFEAHPKTKTAEAKINEARNAAKKELEDLMADYQRKAGQLKKLDEDPRQQQSKARSDLAAEVQKLEVDVRDFQKTREKQLQDQSVALRAEIVADINATMTSSPVLRATGLVLDKSGQSLNGIPIVLYANKDLDRSGSILRSLGATGGVSGFHEGRALGFATVDMKKVFEGYYKTKEAEVKINEARNAAKKELDQRLEEAKGLAETVRKIDADLGNSKLSATAKTAKAAERARKATSLETLNKEITEFQALREKQLQEQSTRMRAAIVSDMTQVIQDGVAGEGRVQLLFDSSGPSLNGIPVVIHVDGIPDWTEAVLATLNSTQPGAKKIPIGRANGSVSTSGLRMGVINMKRVFESIPATKRAERDINVARNAAKKELEDRVAASQRLLDGVRKIDADLAAGTVPAAAREQTAKSRSDKVAELQARDVQTREFQKTREKELSDMSVKLRAEIVESLNKLLFDRASKSGYHVVFDSSGPSLNGVQVVNARSGVPDLSDEVIVALGGTTP